MKKKKNNEASDEERDQPEDNECDFCGIRHEVISLKYSQ